MDEPSESVRIVDWLAARVPAPPPALATIISSKVDKIECNRRKLPDHLVDAAVRILDHLGDGRESANDLLAADALVTYAIEAAVEQGGDPTEYSLQVASLLASARLTQ